MAYLTTISTRVRNEAREPNWLFNPFRTQAVYKFVDEKEREREREREREKELVREDDELWGSPLTEYVCFLLQNFCFKFLFFLSPCLVVLHHSSLKNVWVRERRFMSCFVGIRMNYVIVQWLGDGAANEREREREREKERYSKVR